MLQINSRSSEQRSKHYVLQLNKPLLSFLLHFPFILLHFYDQNTVGAYSKSFIKYIKEFSMHIHEIKSLYYSH